MHLRSLNLLADPPDSPAVSAGYLDLLGDSAQTAPPTGLAHRLMNTPAVAAVYENYWRPWLGQLAKGIGGPTMTDEVSSAIELLRLHNGDTVLDVACGTGRFTRAFGAVVGPDGLAIGLDGSRPMLERAVAGTTSDDPVEYLRADAVHVPFQSATMDGVCCFAALHMFADSGAALDSFADALKPGGRIALLTSARRARQPVRAVDTVIGQISGQHMFDRDEVRELLSVRGFTDIAVRFAGVTQLVSATLAS